jgi:hypothetical protein
MSEAQRVRNSASGVGVREFQAAYHDDSEAARRILTHINHTRVESNLDFAKYGFMAKPAYRKASEWSGWWLEICLLGVAGQIGMIFFLSLSGLMNRLGAWSFIPGVMPTLIAMLIGWRVLARFNRTRLRLLGQRLEPLGFQMTVKPTEAAKTEFAAPIVHLFPTLELQHGAARLQWFAVQTSGSVRALLFEHEYVTGSGKFTQVHHHTIVAWPASHPEIGDAALPTAPWFLIARYPWLVRRAKEKGSLKDPAFAGLADH